MGSIDENFICGRCGGTLIPVGLDGELKIYECSLCRTGGQIECPICHCPRTLWEKIGEICFFCSKNYNPSFLKELFKTFFSGAQFNESS